MSDALDKAEAYLESVDLLDSPGAVLYSSEATLRPGPVYLLGLNPGGAEDLTLQDSIARSRAGHNSYLDEQWAPGGHLQPPGQATLQRRVQGLCAMMKLPTRDVPASNLVFTRSTRLSYHLDFQSALRLCQPVHEIFFEAIKPAFLMTFGSIDNFRESAAIESLETRLARHGTWKAHRGTAMISGRRVRFGNVPHLSLWASDKRSDVVEWVLEGFWLGIRRRAKVTRLSSPFPQD